MFRARSVGWDVKSWAHPQAGVPPRGTLGKPSTMLCPSPVPWPLGRVPPGTGFLPRQKERLWASGMDTGFFVSTLGTPEAPEAAGGEGRV